MTSTPIKRYECTHIYESDKVDQLGAAIVGTVTVVLYQDHLLAVAAAYERGAREMRERAAAACAAERIVVEYNSHYSDPYNDCIEDCVRAVRALPLTVVEPEGEV